MSRKVKGMVSLQGVTYRIVRVATGSYSVVRIRDDQEVGAFKTAPSLGIDARLIEPALLREVARLAIHTAKTSYAGFPAPLGPLASTASPPPLASAGVPVASPAPAAPMAQSVPQGVVASASLRQPSSMPPPLTAT